MPLLAVWQELLASEKWARSPLHIWPTTAFYTTQSPRNRCASLWNIIYPATGLTSEIPPRKSRDPTEPPRLKQRRSVTAFTHGPVSWQKPGVTFRFIIPYLEPSGWVDVLFWNWTESEQIVDSLYLLVCGKTWGGVFFCLANCVDWTALNCDMLFGNPGEEFFVWIGLNWLNETEHFFSLVKKIYTFLKLITVVFVFLYSIV